MKKTYSKKWYKAVLNYENGASNVVVYHWNHVISREIWFFKQPLENAVKDCKTQLDDAIRYNLRYSIMQYINKDINDYWKAREKLYRLIWTIRDIEFLENYLTTLKNS